MELLPKGRVPITHVQHTHSFASFRSIPNGTRGARFLFVSDKHTRAMCNDRGGDRYVPVGHPALAPLGERLSALGAKAEKIAKHQACGVDCGKRGAAKLRPIQFAIAALVARVAREDRAETRRRRHAPNHTGSPAERKS